MSTTMKTTTYDGWHFLADRGKLRDGRDAPEDGEWLHHDGDLEMCVSGLHWSKDAIDALRYSPGGIACRIQARGETLHDTDKSVSHERMIVWRVDAREVLNRFARACALDVAHLWDAPQVMLRWLRTGDPSLADEARAAADAALDARAPAWSARSAAWYASRDAVQSARAATWPARAAAWYAAREAQDAAANSEWHAAQATRDRQNLLLAALLEAEHRRMTDAASD